MGRPRGASSRLHASRQRLGRRLSVQPVFAKQLRSDTPQHFPNALAQAPPNTATAELPSLTPFWGRDWEWISNWSPADPGEGLDEIPVGRPIRQWRVFMSGRPQVGHASRWLHHLIDDLLHLFDGHTLPTHHSSLIVCPRSQPWLLRPRTWRMNARWSPTSPVQPMMVQGTGPCSAEPGSPCPAAPAPPQPVGLHPSHLGPQGSVRW